MTELKPVNFGVNEYCGPSVLSVLTGKSTDECAAVISSITGRTQIKAVNTQDLVLALERLRFDVEKRPLVARSLFGVLSNLSRYDGLYIVFVPKHVVAIRVENKEVFICDNHTKSPINAKSSARLTQPVDLIYKVTSRGEIRFIRSEIDLEVLVDRVRIYRDNIYEDSRDNTKEKLGEFRFKTDGELTEIVNKLVSKSGEVS